jgi:hypothetical protein
MMMVDEGREDDPATIGQRGQYQLDAITDPRVAGGGGRAAPRRSWHDEQVRSSAHAERSGK